MTKFHNGDRVRLVHSFGQGVVVGRDERGLVRVMLDDGFEVPAQDRDLALIHDQEKASFAAPAPAKEGGRGGTRPAPPGKQAVAGAATPSRPAMPMVPEKPTVVARAGLYLAFSSTIAGSEARELYLINNTGLHWAIAFGFNREGKYETTNVLASPARSSHRLAEIDAATLQRRPVFQIWALSAQPGEQQKPGVLHTAWHLPADIFTHPAEPAPLLGKPMHSHQLDAKAVAAPTQPALDTEALLDKWFNHQPSADKKGKSAPIHLVPGAEVDLHIEQLSSNAATLSTPEILTIQLDAFERNLDAAIASGMEEIVFVHGVGNGTLRQELHRRLAQHKAIAFFQDWKKEKFGYGATLVKF